jgi:NAD(P)H-nitrite reductase large subunit
MKNIIIIGNGIAGITAARHIRKLSDCPITVISSESPYFFSRTALMYVYMGHMKVEHTKPYEDWFWQKNNINLVFDTVNAINVANKQVCLTKQTLQFDTLIIATGSVYNLLPDLDLTIKGIQGLYHLQDLALLEENTKNIQEAVIVGGGLIGVELAEMLHTRKIKVTMLVREKSFWATVLPKPETLLVTRQIEKHGINIQFGTEIDKIHSDDTHNQLKSIVTKNGETIDCQFLGLTIGVSPNIDLVKNTTIETKKGILVDAFLQTNHPDIYAIGDCVEHRTPPEGRKAVEQIWYTGKIMGETVAKTICQKPTPYQPGIFYNSAKFFDIEYQVYGNIPNETPEYQHSFYWENTTGEKCLRINYTTDSQSIVGIHAFGIRLRQAVCEDWITKQKSIEYCLENLQDANFDPEFFKQYEPEIVAHYNQEHPENTLKLRVRKGFSRFFQPFLS